MHPAVLSRLPPTYICLVLVVLLCWCTRESRGYYEHDDAEIEPPLKIGVISTTTSFFSRKYSGQLRKTIRGFQDSSDPPYNVTKYYILHGQMLNMVHYSPSEIMSKLCLEIMNNNISTIFYLSNSDYLGEHTAAGQYLMQVANFIGIPVLAWNGENPGFFQPTGTFRILQLAPSISHQCRAMLALLRRYEWPSFSIVTGSLAGETHFISILRDLVDENEDKHINIDAVVQIIRKDPDVIASQLQKLVIEETRVIFLYASKPEAVEIYKVAATMGLTGRGYVWVVSQNIVGDISKIRAAPDEFPTGIIGMHFSSDAAALMAAITEGVSVWVNGVEKLIVDQESGKLANFSLIPELSCDMNDQSFYWPNGNILFEYIKNASTVDGQPVFNDDGTIVNSELHINNLDHSHQWKEIGLWTADKGLTIEDVTWAGNATSPPSGRPAKYHLKVVTLEEPPYINYLDVDPTTGLCPPMAVACRVNPRTDDETDTNYTNIVFEDGTSNATVARCCSGLCIDLLKMLGEKIQFEFDIFEVEDRKWGAYDTTKNEWNGLIRTLMDGKADLCMTSLKITPERNEQVEFSVPFLETGITIIVAVRDGVISPTAFLEPFDIVSWIFILVFCIHLVSLTVFLFEWISPSGYDLQPVPPLGTEACCGLDPKITLNDKT